MKRFLILALGITLTLQAQRALTAQEVGEASVNFLIGKVSYKTNDSNATWKPLKKGDKIGEGDTISTGNGSTATINYKNSEIKISPNTTIQVKSLYAKGKDGSVEVKNGMAWFKLEKLEGQKFQTVTPTATAGVRGTAFATLYDEKTKSSMNCICDGKVEVASTEKGAKSKIIEKGSGSSFQSGDTKIDLTSYKNDIVKKESNPSFQKKIDDSPLLKNCLSCHTPKGWKAEGVIKDDKYSK